MSYIFSMTTLIKLFRKHLLNINYVSDPVPDTGEYGSKQDYEILTMSYIHGAYILVGMGMNSRQTNKHSQKNIYQ